MRCWLAHVDRSGTVLAPGDPDQPWRFVDVRDLADWMLDVPRPRASRPVQPGEPARPRDHRVVPRRLSRSGAQDARRCAGSGRRRSSRAGIDRFDALPGWLPPLPEYDGFLTTDVGRALAGAALPALCTRRSRTRWRGCATPAGWAIVPTGTGPEPLGLDPALERAALAG